MADSSGVFVRRSSEESRHYSWHFPSTFAVTIITALEIKCAVEGGGRHGRDGALITSLIVVGAAVRQSASFRIAESFAISAGRCSGETTTKASSSGQPAARITIWPQALR